MLSYPALTAPSEGGEQQPTRLPLPAVFREGAETPACCVPGRSEANNPCGPYRLYSSRPEAGAAANYPGVSRIPGHQPGHYNENRGKVHFLLEIKLARPGRGSLKRERKKPSIQCTARARCGSPRKLTAPAESPGLAAAAGLRLRPRAAVSAAGKHTALLRPDIEAPP